MTPDKATDFPGRFREVISDPINLLIRRVPAAGSVTDGLVTLHNGHRVPLTGTGAYYGGFSEILRLNRGVHEPLEEFAFQCLLPHLPEAPRMLELGAYWGHYAMWMKQARPGADVHLVEPEAAHLAVGRENFARHGYSGVFLEDFVGPGRFEVDRYLAERGMSGLTLLHSDIQGYELAMLDGARQALSARIIDYCMISTHGQELHRQVGERLSSHGYRIEASADFDGETTSYDGFIFAVAPHRPKVMPDIALIGRIALLEADPGRLVAYVAALAAGAGLLAPVAPSDGALAPRG